MKEKNIQIGLDEGWVLDVASGSAPRAIQVFVDCHSALNPIAHDIYSRAEYVFGSWFEDECGTELSPGALDQILLDIERISDDPVVADPEQIEDTLYPEPLRLALNECSQKKWRKCLGGYSEIMLDSLCEPDVRARLLSIPHGKGAPEHDHGGEEGTLVLMGSFEDGHERFKRGDACTVTPGTVHNPRVDSKQGCICLAVELGPIKPTNAFYSLFNRFFC